MRRITSFGGGGYETKNEWNTMSMINKSEPISLTCLQPEQSLTTLFYRRVAPLLVYS